MHLYTHRTLTVARRVHYVASLQNHFRILLLFHILSHGRYHRDPSINSSFTYFTQIIVGEICGSQIQLMSLKLAFKFFSILNDFL